MCEDPKKNKAVAQTGAIAAGKGGECVEQLDILVNEICKRVQERLDALDMQGGRISEASDKPKLLILTQEHGTICHEALECPKLAEYYQTECALLKEYACDMQDYEAVIAYNLTNEALGKIANGIFDNGYTRLFGTALLTGKKIFIPEEEVELFRYRNQAPILYYRRLEENLKLLRGSGVVIAANKDLQSLILTGQPGESSSERTVVAEKPAAAPEKPVVSEEQPEAEQKEICISKKVITEKDITAAHGEKALVVVVQPKAILTDLAKEYAKKHRMTIVRRDPASSQRG